MIDIEDALVLSKNNQFSLSYSDNCGCYHCLEKFKPKEITEWVDDGETALCPKCGIDAVLPDSRCIITKDSLREVNKVAFGIDNKK